MKIILLNSNIKEPIAKNRINEFISRGFDIEVYYFDRAEWSNSEDVSDPRFHNLGSLKSGASSYLGRLKSQYSAIKKLVNSYEGQNVVFYLMGFDLGLFYKLTGSKIPYIYEESDLRHTYFKPKIVEKIFEKIDKNIISNALVSTFTSEGFIKYHYGSYEAVPSNATFIPNKLGTGVRNFPFKARKKPSTNKLKIGFVGSPRFKSIYNFARVFCENFQNHEFHFFGAPLRDGIADLKCYNNCHFHGAFKSPDDLPEIYNQIDLVLSTYDTHFENVRYAEPNKIYESIYFEVPIIVSSNTFLADKVQKLGIGYDVDPFNENEIVNFIKELTPESIVSKSLAASRIPKDSLICVNDEMFEKIKNTISSI